MDDEMKLPWRRSPDHAYRGIFEKLQDEVIDSDVPDREFISGLSYGQRLVYALGTLERAVLSDGWEGYFWNKSGDTFLEAIEGAKTLGVPEWIKLLDRAAQTFPDGYSTDIDERQSKIDHLDEPKRLAIFGPLTSACLT
jgi:hypothetical protein